MAIILPPAVEIAIRVGVLLLLFSMFAVWEWLAPRRAAVLGRSVRWVSNVSLNILGALLIRLFAPASLVGIALLSQGSGLIGAASLPGWLAAVIGFIALDFLIYGQHVLFHRIGLLWRFHRLHHADLDLDITTALRFHPVEFLLSFVIKAAAVILLGVPPLAVLVFEIALNSLAIFNHANISLPPALEPIIRTVLVTPEMHEVHHSVVKEDTDSNYGFNISLWDRLFGTYRAKPTSIDGGVRIGLTAFRQANENRLGRLLTQPFR